MAIFAWLMMRKRWASVAMMVTSGLTIALMVFEVVHISSTQFAGLGFGVIVCLVGGIAGFVGASWDDAGLCRRRLSLLRPPASRPQPSTRLTVAGGGTAANGCRSQPSRRVES